MEDKNFPKKSQIDADFLQHQDISVQNRQDLPQSKQPEQLREFAFKPGQSGNPSGRSKMTAEQKQLMKDIRSLGPKAYAAMVQILDSDRVMAMAKVKVIELILNYSLGKPENTVKLAIDPAAQVIASEMRIAALVQKIQISADSTERPALMDQNYTPEQMQRMGLILPQEDEEDEE